MGPCKNAWTSEPLIFFNASVCCVKQSMHNYNVVLVLINCFDLVARSRARTVNVIKRITKPLLEQKNYQVHFIYNTKLYATGTQNLPPFVHKPMNKCPTAKSVYVLSHAVFEWLKLRSWYLWHRTEYKMYNHKTASNMLPCVVIKKSSTHSNVV